MSAQNAQHQSTRSEEIHDSDGSLFSFSNIQLSTALFTSMISLLHFVLQVAVKCRPLRERERGRDIVRVIESKVILAECDWKFLFIDIFVNQISAEIWHL